LKRFLTNLLIFFALALCALVAVQWGREAHLRQQLQAKSDSLSKGSQQLRDLQEQMKRAEADFQRVEQLRMVLSDRLATNHAELLALKKELDNVRKNADIAERTAKDYKAALQQANANIERQNYAITNQNQQMKSLADEHASLVARYKKLAHDFDDLAQRWNDQQKELAAKANKQ
jgi:chromosome segregation ATPase